MPQLSLSSDYRKATMSIPEVATQLQVSVATVRNWIKAGYLQQFSNSDVTRKSLSDFTQKYVGSSKLTSRANKSSKDKSECSFDVATYKGTDISSAYEGSLSDSYKNKEGIFYTPSSIVSDMMCDVYITGNETFLEPCCGSGNFILEAVKHGFKPENIYAFDVDANAVEIAKRRLYEATGYLSPNIQCADFLQVCQTLHHKCDYIYTNPPWGKKIAKADKEKYAKIYHAGSSNDTCALFFFASMSLLKENGELGLLLPEAFFNITAFEDARRCALSYTIKRLMDYGKAFKGLLTKAMALVLRNTAAWKDVSVQCEKGELVIKRTLSSFCKAPKSIMNFSYDEQVAAVIEYLYSLPHTTLSGNANWGLGIVTGNNEELCSPIPKDGYVAIYRGKDISSAGLAEPKMFIHKDLSRCQQVAPMSMYLAPEKIIYRFISDKLVFYCDTRQRYILNSANMLIPNVDFPLSSRQLADVMNSALMNWLFRMLFATHKILRGDLEMLPIFADYFRLYAEFDENKYLDFLNLEEKDGTYRIKNYPFSNRVQKSFNYLNNKLLT